MSSRHGIDCLAGMLVGAGAMYLLDPEQGKRRRALVRDQFIHGIHLLEDAYDDVAQDASNRMRGVSRRTRAWMRHEPIADDVLTERVRSRLGRLVSHPRAIDVTAEKGRVTLKGPVFRHEVERALHRIAAISGVREVDNQLDPHIVADVPGLQGGPTEPPESQIDVAQRHWLPATRFVIGLAGSLLSMYGVSRPTLSRTLAGLAGLSMLTRAMTNAPLEEIFDAEFARK
jgi:hypothetical protein